MNVKDREARRRWQRRSRMAGGRSFRWGWVVPLVVTLLFLHVPSFVGSTTTEAAIESEIRVLQPVREEKAAPLQRFPDPIIVLGETLPQEWLGAKIGSIRVYHWKEGLFQPIRFQVDERTPEGDWIFPYGKKNNGPRSNGRLDPQDLVLFMAKDAGGKADDLSALPGDPLVLPVELTDPVDGGTAWVYLASYAGEAPALCPLPAYVSYDAEREILSSPYARAEYLITEDGLHTTFYKSHSTPPGAGGTGENLVDRLKFRVDLRFLFNLVPLSLHEEMLGSDVIAYIWGPIRLLRRIEQFVKLPFGIRGVKTYADVEVYESFSTVPITLQVPRGFHRVVSSASLRYGTDYAPNVIGSCFRNSEMDEPFIIDGRMSEAEKRFSRSQDQWRIFYGPYGVLMTRAIYPEELLDIVEVRQGYMDDLNTAMPVERYPGSMGYAYTEILTTKVRSGTYRIFLDFYFPPHYEPGDEVRFLQVRDNPLHIRIGDRETPNPQSLYGVVGEDF